MLRKFLTLFTLALAVNAVLMSFIWARHLFVSGLNPFLGTILAVLLFLLLIPLVIYVLKRIARFLKRTVGLSPATLFIFGALLLFTAHILDVALFGNYPSQSKPHIRLRTFLDYPDLRLYACISLHHPQFFLHQ